MIRTSFKYAILCGIFLIGLFIVSLAFGSNPLIEVRHLFFDLGILALFIFFAGKEFRDVQNDGILHFWQGVSVGLIVFMPAIFLFSLTLFIMFELNPEIIDEYKVAAKILQESKRDLFLEVYSEEDLQNQLKVINSITSLDLSIKTLGKKFLAGFLVTPVVAIILRKNHFTYE